MAGEGSLEPEVVTVPYRQATAAQAPLLTPSSSFREQPENQEPAILQGSPGSQPYKQLGSGLAAGSWPGCEASSLGCYWTQELSRGLDADFWHRVSPERRNWVHGAAITTGSQPLSLNSLKCL